MTPSDDALLAWPPRGRPRQRKAFLEAVADAAARLDWPAVAAALRCIPPDEFPAHQAPAFLSAAQHLGSPDLLEQAVSAAVAVPMPPIRRASLAWRLALAKHTAEASRLLMADPATLAETRAYTLVVRTLDGIIEDRRIAASLRAEAAAVLQRYTNRVPVERVRAPYAFAAGPGGARPGSGPAAILPAPGVPAALIAAYSGAVGAFEARLRTRANPGVTELRDVFVNRIGQIWLANAHVVVDHRRAIPEASRAAAADAPSLPEAVLALDMHNNIYHWLGDCLASIAWRLEPGAPDIPVLIRDDPAPFVMPSLRMAGAAPVDIRAVGDALHVGRLFAGTPGFETVAPLGAHRRLIDSIAAAADAALSPGGGSARRLYISRRDSRRRPMGNEVAVEEALAALGFRAAMFSTLDLPQQIRLMRDAEVVVAPHGAGLSLALFARPGTAVFEIMPGSTVGAQLTTCMTRVSRLVGHRHAVWLEAMDLGTRGWTVNLPAMLPALAAFIDGGEPLR